MKPSTCPSYSNSKTLSKITGDAPDTSNVPVRGILFTSKAIDNAATQAPIIVTNLDGITSTIQTSRTSSTNGVWKNIIFIPLSIQNLQRAGDNLSSITNFNVFF
tara:strand:- start:742 stop:1053 length:312 start_codon:yes stop_codon:yes gene_type:complete